MDLAEKILDIVIWMLIISGMFWFAYGCYELVDLFFIRG